MHASLNFGIIHLEIMQGLMERDGFFIIFLSGGSEGEFAMVLDV